MMLSYVFFAASVAAVGAGGIGYHKHDCKAKQELLCQQEGCTWSPVDDPTHKTPWCFYWTNRFDCSPGQEVNNATCQAKGCIWKESKIPALPWCFYRLPDAFIDCHPDKGATEEQCTKRGCLWIPAAATTGGMPYCVFQGGDSLPGYDLASGDSTTGTNLASTNGLWSKLRRRNTPTIYGGDVETVYFKATPITNKHIRIQINDVEEDIKSHSPEITNYLATPHDTTDLQYTLNVSDSPFGFSVTDRQGKVVFDTTNLPGLTIAKQFVQLSTKLNSKYLYGIGETAQPRLLRNLTWHKVGLFARDIAPDAAANPNQNLYGMHPFYLSMDEDGRSHGVYWNNMHGLNIALQSDPLALSYRAIGGMIDLHIIVGESPEDVIRSYVAMIGKPMLPPYWGLGFQLSRYGYKDLNNFKAVVDRNVAARIPMDVQYVDIDYMDSWRDFTVGPHFSGLGDYAKELKSKGMHLALITDPGIPSANADVYKPTTLGIAMDVFIKNSSGQNLIGKVWPGLTYYPDFTHPNASAYWLTCLKDFHKEVAFDGMWYDMNEPSNFLQGSTDGCPQTSINHPPFIPVSDDPLYTKTICLDAVSYGNVLQYEIHNLYGYHETQISHGAHLKLFPGKRPFLLSRSTAPGSGVHTAHWSGDVFSHWETLRYSIINMVKFSMFGMSWTGSDICGFNGATTELLCVRWQQLGAFYPFSRNHNAIGERDQDPAVWSDAAVAAIRSALQIRYKYLPYIYTLMVRATLNGSTVARPMFFEFPKDSATYEIDTQFMLGSALMVAPVVAESNQSTIYFPKGSWYGLEMSEEGHTFEVGVAKDYTFPIDKFGLFLRGGRILPWQEPGVTTAESRKGRFGFVVGFESTKAVGELFWDDGESLNSYGGGEHIRFALNASISCERPDGYFTISKREDTYSAPPILKLGTVQLRGLKHQATKYFVDGKEVPISNVKVYSNGWVEISKLDVDFAAQESTVLTWK